MNEAVIVLLTLSYSLILGIIVAQVALTAPVVFKVLDNDNASKFLRAIFPRYYLLLFLICLVALLISYLWFSVIDIWIALTASLLAFIGFIIIPLTNSARDRGWNKLFKFLHNISVLNTIILFIIAVAQLVRIS
jgi:vacuolar-type H+-ATPase subunit I/STV1